MVLVVLSADLSASFYIAWMIVSLLFGIPQSLSTVLYAVGSGDPGTWSGASASASASRPAAASPPC